MESDAPITSTGNSFWIHETRFSKYLALILFIALPFIGGWVGYLNGPEKIVEIQKYVPSNTAMFDAGRVTILSDHPTGEYSGEYPQTRRYLFENGLFKVSFSFSSLVSVDESHNDAQYSLPRGQGYLRVSFRDFENEPLFMLEVADLAPLEGDAGCYKAYCFQDSTTTVQIIGSTWNDLGAFEYCEVGECERSNHLYSRKEGEFVEYLRSDIALDSEEALNNRYISQVLTSLKVERVSSVHSVD